MRGMLIVTMTALATFVMIWALAVLAVKITGVPNAFPPFTALPLASGVAGGFFGASAMYAIIRTSSANADRVFFLAAITCLALSFGLPLRLSYTKSSRFLGVTPSAQMTLALFHTIVAVSSVTVLTRLAALGK